MWGLFKGKVKSAPPAVSKELPKDLDLCPFMQIPCVKAACHQWVEMEQTVTMKEFNSDGSVKKTYPAEKTVGMCAMKWPITLLMETRDAVLQRGVKTHV